MSRRAVVIEEDGPVSIGYTIHMSRKYYEVFDVMNQMIGFTFDSDHDEAADLAVDDYLIRTT